MGRSVSVPTNAEIVTYINVSDMVGDDFEYYLEDLISRLKYKMPSLQESEEWLDREDRAILENDLVYIGVSAYGNTMSLWIVPKDQYEQLAYNWISKIAQHITELGDLVKQGTMSNGVSVYNKKETK